MQYQGACNYKQRLDTPIDLRFAKAFGSEIRAAVSMHGPLFEPSRRNVANSTGLVARDGDAWSP